VKVSEGERWNEPKGAKFGLICVCFVLLFHTKRRIVRIGGEVERERERSDRCVNAFEETVTVVVKGTDALEDGRRRAVRVRGERGVGGGELR
jgi:uncharacterized OsmC-like protein